jgi:hypothetical protein
MAQAGVNGLPFDPSLFSNPSALISQDIANAIIQTAGILADHRPYEPATSLGTQLGLEVSVEATIYNTPSNFISALTQAGLTDTSGINFVPLAKVHIHKGLSDRLEVGLSTVFFEGYYMWGADLKVVTYIPEEGPVWAVRFGYSRSELGFVSTNTYTPAVLVSQPLDFMEPYLGVAMEVINGTIDVPLPSIVFNGVTYSLPDLTAQGSGIAGMGFLGVVFRTPIGLRLTMEGAYNTLGADSLGLKFGFNF